MNSDRKIYTLNTDFAGFESGSIVVYMDDIWYVGNQHFDTRGSVQQGEIAMTFYYWQRNKITSILNPMDEEDEE